MNPSRNREIEIAQAGLRRSYVKDHAMNGKTVSQSSRSFLQAFGNVSLTLPECEYSGLRIDFADDIPPRSNEFIRFFNLA